MAAKLDAAARLADWLNYFPIAVFGLWLGPLPQLWLALAGPMRPFARPEQALAPLPWFIAAVLGGIATLWLPRGWYRVRAAEPRLYRRIGILAFRRFTTNGDALVRFVRRRHPGYTVHRQDFSKALARTYFSERSHLVCLVFGLVTSAYLLAVGWYDWLVWTSLTNIVANLYPILLQRYTRARLARLGISWGSAPT